MQTRSSLNFFLHNLRGRDWSSNKYMGEVASQWAGRWTGGKKYFFLFFRPSPLRLSPGRHTVFVLMNELVKCMKQRPSLGSQKRSADHYAVRSLVGKIFFFSGRPMVKERNYQKQHQVLESRWKSFSGRVSCDDRHTKGAMGLPTESGGCRAS